MSELAYHRPVILNQVDYDRHAVIEASAGTGKTYTIERLFADLVLSGRCDFEQVLTVTFTEKATGELRGRVRATLEGILRGDETEPREGHEQVTLDAKGCGRLNAGLNSFERAPIFTIHGFCQRILTDFAFLAGMSFAPEVVDARGAFHRAFRAEVRDALAVNKTTRTLLSEWLRPDDDTKAKKLDDLETLLYQAHHRRYLDREPAARREDVARLLTGFNQSILDDAYPNAAIRKADCELAREEVKRLGKLVSECKGSPDTMLARLGEIDFKALLHPRGANRGRNARRFPNDFDGDEREQIRLLQAAELVALAKDSREGKLIDQCVAAIERRLEADKRNAGQIDFDDMLSLLWHALEGESGESLVAALRRRYRYALLDEFQDTDDLQWKIFRRVFVNDSPGNVLYVVGDPKQAIYAFRGADVFTYLEAREQLVDAGAGRIPLARNFRSTQNMIEALNHVLDQSAPTPLFNGEIKYDDPVECGKTELTARANGKPLVPVTLMRFHPASPAGAGAPAMREALGRHIAAILRRVLKDPAHRIEISGDGEPKFVTAGDVLVLTRTHNESEEIGGYLREADVPFSFYKKEGLFQTNEARDILDVLRAVETPGDRSRRLSAWAAPFFNVPFRDLAQIGDPSPEHPLLDRLYRWNVLGERDRFADLFASLLHESGLVERELLLSDSERELSNYLHIFEVLLEQSRTRQRSLAEIITLLDDYIKKRETPPGLDGNVQRLESERQAVQVMTVHMSKGLEADVVVLYGGLHKGQGRDALAVFHRDRHVRFAMGEQRKLEFVSERLTREEAEENQRLLYVGMTRARAKLYLPFLPAASKLTGYYSALNRRIGDIVGEVEDAGARDRIHRRFSIEDVTSGGQTSALPAVSDQQLATWSPPDNLLDDSRDGEMRDSFLKVAGRHHPFRIASYTSLHALAATSASDIPVEEFKSDIPTANESDDLAGGRNVGIFLHETIENLDMNSFRESDGFDSWKTRDDIRTLFSDGMRRHQVRDSRWLERGPEVVYNTLTTSIDIASERPVGPLWSLRHVREMEFLCPISGADNSTLTGVTNDGNWKIEHGYLKGFVDFVFENSGKVCFADWKSDLLASYDASTIETHVKDNYQLQAAIYCVGVLRLLRIRDASEYHKRFGGLMYIFLRGTRPGSVGRDGVYFHRPGWDEILAYQEKLAQVVEAARR